MSTVPRMRTIPKAFEELKKLDPDTALTKTTLEKMVKRGEIPVVMVGQHRLINLDVLFETLYGLASEAPKPPQQMIGIHPINI